MVLAPFRRRIEDHATGGIEDGDADAFALTDRGEVPDLRKVPRLERVRKPLCGDLGQEADVAFGHPLERVPERPRLAKDDNAQHQRAGQCKDRRRE